MSRERWIGTYASASDRLMLIDRPSDDCAPRLITSGTGASTSFAIAEEVIDESDVREPSHMTDKFEHVQAVVFDWAGTDRRLRLAGADGRIRRGIRANSA